MVLAVSAWVTLAGCLVVPVDYHAAGSRQNITTKTAQQLRPGTTTKEEILLQLGEPDYTSEDGRTLAYAWTKVGALVIVGGYGSAAAAEVGKSHHLVITFDDNNRVSQTEVRGGLWSGQLR